MKTLKNLPFISVKICFVIIASCLSLLAPATALAGPGDTCGDSCSTGAGQGPSGNTGSNSTTTSTTSSAGACKDTTDSTGKVTSATVNKCVDQTPIVKDLQNIVNFLAALVGVIVIGSLIFGGIQYTIAGDNSNLTGAAKKRIINSLVALAAFIFTYAFLQWLIPGGVFK